MNIADTKIDFFATVAKMYEKFKRKSDRIGLFIIKKSLDI
jgi:hypothetical protein